MATATETEKPKATRRHPLQVTASRIRDAIKEYPQAFDGPARAVAEVLARRLDDAVDGGLQEGAREPAFGPPVHPGEPVDQRERA